MTDEIGLGFGYILGGVLILISIMTIIDSLRTDDVKEAQGAYVLLLIGAILFGLAAGYDVYGNGWTKPPSPGEYRILLPQDGSLTLVPLKTKEAYTPLYHQLPKEAITFVQVAPDDPKANMLKVVGTDKASKMIVYLPDASAPIPPPSTPQTTNQSPTKPTPPLPH